MLRLLRFYGSLFLAALGVLRRATYWWVDTLAVVPFVLWFASQLFPERTRPLIEFWQHLSPWYSLIPIGLLLLYGLMKANFETFQAVERQRDDFQHRLTQMERQQVEDSKDRDAKNQSVAVQLAEFHAQGERLILQILDDEDPAHEDQWFERSNVWLRQLLQYVADHVSQGKAEYLRYIPILADVSILHHGKAVSQRRTQFIRGIEVRMQRLREIMKDL